MYAVRTDADFPALERRIERAIRLEQPITFTYRELKKDPENPKRRLPGQYEITVRTVEPYSIEQSAKGNWFIRSLDRKTGEFRSWRFDRVVAYTPHRGIRVVTVKP
jgi:predicted DNA-binding transcriptional regulator YafY